MALFSKRNTNKNKERIRRLHRHFKPTVQNTLLFTSLAENGLMHIADHRYSRTFKLGDVSYSTAQAEQQTQVIEAHATALNVLATGQGYQLLVLNRKTDERVLENILYPLRGDRDDLYRKEYNKLIEKRFDNSSHNFEIEKYITLSQDAVDEKQAQLQLRELGVAMKNRFEEASISFQEMTGKERLSIFSSILRGERDFPYSYEEIESTGLSEKSFVSPNRLVFHENYLEVDDRVGKIQYIRYFPSRMTDRLVKELTNLGIEIAISIQASPYDSSDFLEQIRRVDAGAKRRMVKSQKDGAGIGVTSDLAVAGADASLSQSAALWRAEIEEYEQRVYSGVITVFYQAETVEELRNHQKKVEQAGKAVGVRFEDLYYYQEEALNSILPIGEAFLDVKSRFMRDMTTDNLATQIPHTNVDLRSKSPRARYYGQNQLSGNVINLDRKKDLNTPSGIILGGSGSGKSMTVKSNEIIPTLLKYPEDRVIVVDPDDEYSDIGREFGAEIIDVAIGSTTCFNLLDLPNQDKLRQKDNDPKGNKANLLVSLFDHLLGEIKDGSLSIIDRVTRLTYDRYPAPTLKEWHAVLKEQPEKLAQDLALDLEIYLIGAYSIFSQPTNVDLSNRFIIFNLNKLSGKLKNFAMMVLQDFLWNQVVEARGEQTIWLYFDEIQLYFENKAQGKFFNEMYSRIRKYGSIPTGITQNPETLTNSSEGRRLLGNCQFKILLKLDMLDRTELESIVSLTDSQRRFITTPKAKGTGLIVAGDTIVPFENPIPEDTRLYQLLATDA